MAYAFDNINNLLDPAQQQGGTNIFSSGQATQSPEQPSSAAGQSGSAAKTSTEGELSPGGSGSSVTGAQTAPEKATPQSSGAAILEKAKGESYNADFANKIVGDVKAGQQKLRDQANQYVQVQRAKGPEQVKDQEVEAGISGDAAAQNKIANLIRGPGVNADTFNANIDSNFQDIDQIGSQGGLQAYLQKRGGERYNAGQAALDSLLFSRDKGFQDTVAKARAEKQALREQQADLDTNLQRHEQQYLNTVQDNARAAAQNLLRSKQGMLQSILQQRAGEKQRAFDEKRGKADEEAKNMAWQPYWKMATGMNAQDRALLDRAKQELDPLRYRDVAQAYNVGLSDVADVNEASRYNAIMQLLGQGGQALSAGSFNPESASSFKADQYAKDLQAAFQRLKANPGSAGGYVATSDPGMPGQNAITGGIRELQGLAKNPQNIPVSPFTSPTNAALSSVGSKKKLKI